LDAELDQPEPVRRCLSKRGSCRGENVIASQRGKAGACAQGNVHWAAAIVYWAAAVRDATAAGRWFASRAVAPSAPRPGLRQLQLSRLVPHLESSTYYMNLLACQAPGCEPVPSRRRRDPAAREARELLARDAGKTEGPRKGSGTPAAKRQSCAGRQKRRRPDRHAIPARHAAD
jgi:hypothetical protein